MNSNHLFAAQEAMTKAIAELEALSSKVGKSRQIVEFCSERRKSALSEVVVLYLETDSATAAEHKARADERYKAKMKEVLNQTIEAENVLTQFSVARLKFESARSILSTEKSLLQL